MKYQLLILMFCSVQLVMGQADSGIRFKISYEQLVKMGDDGIKFYGGYEIDSSNHLAVVKRLQSICEFPGIDSIYLAKKMLSELRRFDSVLYNKSFASQALDKLSNYELSYAKHAILGRWKSLDKKFDLAKDMRYNSETVLDFNAQEVSIFHKDSLIRKSGYLLKAECVILNNKYLYGISIVFPDNQWEWKIEYINELTTRSGHNSVFLYVNKLANFQSENAAETFIKIKEVSSQ